MNSTLPYQPPMNQENEEAEPTSWLELIEKGDGYLTPSQRQAFEQAIEMVLERINETLGKPISPEEENDFFDFEDYISSMEERFLADVQGKSDIEQDAAITAARVIEHLGQIILDANIQGIDLQDADLYLDH